MKVNEIQKRLFEMADDEYRRFSSALVPNVDPERFIGVRVPKIRKFAKELAKEKGAEEFLAMRQHRYYEENQLHSFLIDAVYEDFDCCLEMTEKFLPMIDNWAVCDSFKPKGLKKDKGPLYENIKRWLESKEPFIVRLGIVLQISWFLGEDFEPKMLEQVCQQGRCWSKDMKKAPENNSGRYYVLMAVAWYFSMALVEHYDATMVYFKEKRLPIWVHNKALQKAVESRRFSRKQKEQFRQLKVKE